jgi:hypothetical protein
LEKEHLSLLGKVLEQALKWALKLSPELVLVQVCSSLLELVWLLAFE